MAEKIIKGQLYINTLKKLAKKYGKHTGACAAVDISVWYHPAMETKPDNERFYVRARIWDSSKSMHYEPVGSQEDLRNMAALIDQLIALDKEAEKE